MHEEAPSWLEPGRLIDAKDKHGDWQVALIQRSAKNQIRVRFDGWLAKYDENFSMNSPNIRPFRSVVRGYTGQVKNAGIREHFIFKLPESQQNYAKLEGFINELCFKTEDEITQVIRGHHYIWVDFLLTCHFPTLEDLQHVYSYFSRHIDLNLLYITEMLKADLETWFNSPDQNTRAFAEGHFEIFDSTYSILEGYLRHREFFSSHLPQLAQMSKPVESNNKFWDAYFSQIDFYSHFAKLIAKITNAQSVKVPLTFIRSLCLLYTAIEKALPDKEMKLQLARAISKIILRSVFGITEHTVKTEERELQEIYTKFKVVIMKYSWKVEVLAKMEVARLNCWEKMIKTESLQRKIRGIYNIKRYFQLLHGENKLMMMIYATIDEQKKWLKQRNIIELIFCQNEHHEIIKKGCELVNVLYSFDCIGIEELAVIWNSCRGRLEAVRRVMYTFFQNIVKDTTITNLFAISSLISNSQLNDGFDVEFFYSFAEEVIEMKKKQSPELVHNFLTYSIKRAEKHPQEISKFAGLLVLNSQQIMKFYIEEFIGNISDRDNLPFNLKVIIQIYNILPGREVNLENGEFNKIYNELCHILKTNEREGTQNREIVKGTQNGEIVKGTQNGEIVKMLLDVLEFLTVEFEFLIEEFTEMWNLFNSENNIHLRDRVFYPWLLQCSTQGIFKIPSYSVNKAVKDSQLLKQIFDSTIKNAQVMDYINMTPHEFLIFRQILLDVNQANKKVFFHSHLTGLKYFRTPSLEIDGLNELWNIFLNCRNEDVITKAVELIKQIYLNYPESLQRVSNGEEEKVQRIRGLLLKLDTNIKRGLQKLNMKLISRSLLLLQEVTIEVKESKKCPPELILQTGLPDSKKIARWVFEGNEREKQLPFSENIKYIKKSIQKEFNVKPYNQRVYKIVTSHAGALGKPVTIEQQIPNQQHFAPLFTTIMGKEVFIVKRVPNLVYQLLSEFISQKMQETLLKILSQSDQLSNENSERAYNILVAIPSNKKPSEVINKLIAQHPGMESLDAQSLHYRMYLTKCINSLQESQLKLFISGGWIFNNILKQITVPIVDFINIELIQQIVFLAHKSAKLTEISLLPEEVVLSMTNLLHFISKQHKKQHKVNGKIELFANLFVLIEVLNKKNINELLNSIFSSPTFPELLCLLFKQSSIPKQFRNIFDGKMTIYIKKIKNDNNRILKEKAQDIIFGLIFNHLYPTICLPDNREANNNSFFRFMKDVIWILSPSKLEKLFQAGEKGKGPTKFWDTCLNFIKEESDFHSKVDKYNSFFNGHLQIAETLVSKNPQIVDDDFVNFIFFECLFYDNRFTKTDLVKCKSQKSIQSALKIVQILCRNSEKHLNYVITQLRTLQQTKYWRNAEKWNISLELELKSETGYVGLDNPGCICYLNSFIQTLFMNKSFRQNVINYEAKEQPKEINTNPDILTALRQLFLNLEFSDKKFLSPIQFTKSVRTADNKPMIKLYEQMDIEEFSSILFDKIENLLPSDHNFVKELYQGVYSNEIISQECKHCSEREESFLSIQIDVKSSVQEALKTLVQGEMLEGENAYYCERCDKKVKALKRVSIKKLPDHLLICLKRFQFNFQLEQKIKLNNYCEFSENFSLEEYSRQFLNQRVEESSQNLSKQEIYPKEYFDYKLKGVIIHTGFADNGHYYSLEEVQQGKWLEFNDKFVTQFRLQRLADEAFGSKDYQDSKVQNAYMLVYQRKNKMHSNQPQKMEIQGKIPYLQNETAMKLYREIQETNKQLHIFELLFGSEYAYFVKNIISKILPKVKSSPIAKNVMKFILEYCLLIKTRDVNFLSMIESLSYAQEHNLNSEDPLGSQIVDALIEEISQKDFIFEFFVQPNPRDRVFALSRFLGEVLRKKIQVDGVNCHANIMRMVAAFLEVTIEAESNTNQICYLLRKILTLDKVFYKYYEELDTISLLFDNLTGAKQTPQDKDEKIEKLRLSLRQVVKYLPQNETSGQGCLVIHRKTNWDPKNLAKNQNTEQIWLLILKLFTWQDEIMELGSNEENSHSQNSASSAFELYKTVQNHHNYILAEIDCLSVNRFASFFDSCTSSKASTFFSHFLCQICKNSDSRTQRVLLTIKKSLKVLEATKYKPYLIGLYHMCQIKDSMDGYRISLIVGTLDQAMEANRKYFSQFDILSQWIHKICSCNPSVVSQMSNSKDFLQRLVKTCQLHKHPAPELLKKQKNPNFERHLYRLHGIMVSTEYSDYEKLHKNRVLFFVQLLQKTFTPTYAPQLRQPTVSSLEKDFCQNQQILFFHEKEYVSAVIKQIKYGLVKIAIKRTEQCTFRWENDDRFREGVQVQMELSEMNDQI